MPKSEKQLPPKTRENGSLRSVGDGEKLSESPKIAPTQRAGSNRSLSPLARITSVSQQTLDGVKFLVYGRAKTGKTRFASTFPKPMLLIGTEDGTKSVRSVKGLDFVRIYAADEMDVITEELSTNPGKYRSVALDTAGGLYDLILRETLSLGEGTIQKNYKMTDFKTWGAIAQDCKDRLKNLFNLADQKGINVCIIAHERNFDDDEGSRTDGIAPTVAAALTKSVCNWLNAEVDYIGQMYIRDEVKVTKETVGDEEVLHETPTGRKEYALRVGPHSVCVTGFRQDVGAPPLPEAISLPTFEKVARLMGG